MAANHYSHRPNCYYKFRPELFHEAGLDEAASVECVRAIRAALVDAGISPKNISVNGLDNPLMDDDARACMVNEVLRGMANPRGPNATRKASKWECTPCELCGHPIATHNGGVCEANTKDGGCNCKQEQPCDK